MPWSFKGRLSRAPYALWATVLVLSQHAVTALAYALYREPLPYDWVFALLPLRKLAELPPFPAWASATMLVFALLVAWLLAAATFRRAIDAGANPWLTVLALAPPLQLPLVAILSLLPTNPAPQPEPESESFTALDWRAAVQGILVGTAVTVGLVALGALLFGTYGYGIFVLTPFTIGAAIGYALNLYGDVGGSKTSRLVMIGTAFGGLALILTALEGAICIVMAAPLAIGLALLGGLVGRVIATRQPPRPGQILASVALLPLVFAAEVMLPPSTSFLSVERIHIAAPPGRVWAALVTQDMSSDPITLPYRLGLAHPKRGYIVGEGIGAIRYGEFSTGTAIERVTEWEQNRKLTFIVLHDIPAMHEVSPYSHVHAPHAVGYFNTDQAGYALEPGAGGGTELVLTTAHTLKLDPVFYWLPMARLAVSGNNQRVLANIKRQAER